MRLLRLLSLVLLLFIGKFSLSQPDSIWTLPPEKQIITFLTWYYTDLLNTDSQQIIKNLVKAEKEFAESDNRLLERQAWLFRQSYMAEKNPVGEQRAIMMLDASDEAAQRSLSVTQAECWHFAGSYYFRESQYTLAFEYMQKAQAVFDKYRSDPEYAYLHRYDNVLANCYYHFGEYREAIKYMNNTIQLPSYWNRINFTPGLYNTLALCYQQLKVYDSAAIWFNNSLQAAIAFKDSFYIGLAQGNLGYTYYLQQEYEKALPLLEIDYNLSLKAGELGSALNSASSIAAIYIKQGEIKQAEQYMDWMRKHNNSSGNVTFIKNWYENLYNLYKAKGDYDKAAYYTDSLLAYKDSVAILRDRKAFNQAVLKLETERHMNEVAQLEQDRKQQVLFRNSLLAGLVLLALITLLWLNRQLLKRKKEKELAQQQLQFAEQELITYTGQLKEKNELLEQLREEISRENHLNDREGNINRLLEATILTEEDWRKFRQLFEKVYPGFFVRLKEKIPDLSPADTRLLALTKLQLPPKTMASMLGVSYDAVKKARQRLRKKIDMPEEGSLEELVELITG